MRKRDNKSTPDDRVYPYIRSSIHGDFKIQRTSYYCVSSNTGGWSGMCLVCAVPRSIVTHIFNGHPRSPQKQQQARKPAKRKEMQPTFPRPQPSAVHHKDIKGEMAPSDRYHQHQQSRLRVKDRNKRKHKMNAAQTFPTPAQRLQLNQKIQSE